MKKSIFATALLFCLLFSFSANGQSGLKGEFYNGQNFNRFVGSQIDSNIDFYWNQQAPIEGMNPNLCSVRWTGRLKSPRTGTYTFSARVDDGIRVWVGGVQVINNWQLNDVGYSTGNVKMKADKFYDIKVEYFNALLEAEITLMWKLPEDENRGWFDKMWNGTEVPQVIQSEYFLQPVEEEIVEQKEEAPPIIQSILSKPIEKKITLTSQKKETALAIQKYIPKNVQFAQAQTEILPESFPELDRLAAFLVEKPHHKIKIEGHTDNVGDAEKNFQLSQRRANAVAAYLIKKGVHHERLKAEGFGGYRPLKPSGDGKYHPENRRVEFIVD